MALSLKPVVVLPESAPSRAKVLRALEQVMTTVAPSPPPADSELAVVDLTAEGGPQALESLLLTSVGKHLSVVAVTDVNTPALTGVADVVSSKELESELPLRLRQARERHQTFRDSLDRQRELRVLLELTARYAESTDVEELLHEVTRRLADEIKIDRAALVVVDEEKGAGIIVAASDDAALKDLHIDLLRYPEIREAVRTGKPVIVEDAPSHPLFEGVKDKVVARGIQHIAALPMTVGGSVLGVLLLRRSSGQAFSHREIDFLSTVAHATAIALKNAQRFDVLRGQREREKFARLAAEERERSLKRYERYFDNLSDGVAILDENARVLSLNPAGLRLLDVTLDEAKGRHINALTNPSDENVMTELLSSVAQGKVRSDVDVQARTLAGRRVTVAVSAAPLTGEGEGVAILTLRDVTRQRQLDEELQQTKDFLVRLIDSSVDAIIAANMKGKVILFNKAAEAISGYSAREVLDKLNVRQLYPDHQAREVMEKLRSAELGGVGRLTASRQHFLAKGGEAIPVSMTAAIVYEGEQEIATVGIFTDLRDRLKLERKLSDVEERLEETEKTAMLVALAGAAAHELNQPLTSVMGYAELLKRKIQEADPNFRSIDIIYREAERMAEIVRKIGKITRFETKEYVGDREIIDLESATRHEE